MSKIVLCMGIFIILIGAWAGIFNPEAASQPIDKCGLFMMFGILITSMAFLKMEDEK